MIRLSGYLILEFENNAINRVYWRLKTCAKISLHLLCKSWSSFLDISSIWFIRNFNSCNSFLSSFSSTSVSCFLFLRQNVAVFLLLLSFYQYFVVIFCCSYNIFVILSLLFVSLYVSPCHNIFGCPYDLSTHLVWPDMIIIEKVAKWHDYNHK